MVQDWSEHNTIQAILEETKEGRLLVICTELAVEPWVGGGVSPPLADGGGAGQGGGLRRETEQDLPQEIVVFKRRGQRRWRAVAAATTAADHSGCLLTGVDLGTEARAARASHSLNLGMEARAAAAGDSVALVTCVDWGMETRTAPQIQSESLLIRLNVGVEAWAAAAGRSGGI